MTFPENPNNPENKLTGDRYEALREALEILYIRGNASGRTGFTKEWPEVARHIFGEELIRFDTEGTADRERRGELEEEAEAKRLTLLEIVLNLQEKSVEKGALQKDYVAKLINELGEDIAALLYTEQVIERVRPSSASIAEEPQSVQEDVQPIPEELNPEQGQEDQSA